jgi:hypothetical protein
VRRAVGAADGRGDGRIVGSREGNGVAVNTQRRADPTPPFELKPGLQVQIEDPTPETLFDGQD